MNKWLNTIDRLDQRQTFWGIVALSILLAAWMQYIQHGWINPDSVLYFEQARLIAQGNWHEAMAVYNWPIYGACIALVHKICGLTVHTAAQLLNMVFFGVATCAFLRIIQLAGGTTRTLLAAALLLFSSQYIVGDVLEMLMRDEGFWAFYLLSILFFARFFEHRQTSDALLWQICILLAILFRIEAILYLFLLPTIWFLRHELLLRKRAQYWLLSYGFCAVIGLIFLLSIMVDNPYKLDFGRLNEVFTLNLYQEFTQKLFAQGVIMSEQVLGEYLDEFAIPGLLLTFLYVIASKILTATGLIGTSLAAFSIKHRCTLIPENMRTILLATLGIGLLTAALIIVKIFVLSSRYLVALAWVLLIFAAFFFAELSKGKTWQNKITVLISLVLALGFIKNVLPKRDGYNYMQNAVSWVTAHNSQNQPVFYDEVRMRYYAGLPYSANATENGDQLQFATINDIPQYLYICTVQSQKRPAAKALQEILASHREVKRFCNYEKNKCALIFQRKS